MSEIFTDSREKLQVEFSEIVLSEGREEPLTSGPCRLVVPISSKRLQEPASSGRLTFLEVYIAKIFEVTIYNSTLASGECSSGIGSSNKLNWSIFAGDSEGSKDGQRWIGNYSIPRKLACEKAEEYGLATPEPTLLNQFGIGTTQVDIPRLGIFGGEKINKWKQFVKLFLANFALEVNTEVIMSSIGKALQDPIDKELEDCLGKNPSTSGQLNCLRRAYDQWDEELNRIYKELRQRLDFQGQEVLKAAQLKWIEYRDKEFALIDTLYSGQGGTMQLVFNAARRVAIVKTRVSELHRYVDSSEQVDSQKVLDRGIFEGISERGDFQEALADAIQKAKEQLKTSFVAWTLDTVNGFNGGFVTVNTLKLTITATSRSSDS
ncbi:lysozyme inhibitor LprI family protein [Phormidesmis sp. 146-12]